MPQHARPCSRIVHMGGLCEPCVAAPTQLACTVCGHLSAKLWKSVAFWLRSHWAATSCGCPRSSFELLSIAACLGDYLNSISVVENYMEHSIISEAGLLISDNASGISGMTPLSERDRADVRYYSLPNGFLSLGRDMLNRVKVNARISYFPPPAFCGSFRVFGWILPFQNPFKYTPSFRVNQHMPSNAPPHPAPVYFVAQNQYLASNPRT